MRMMGKVLSGCSIVLALFVIGGCNQNHSTMRDGYIEGRFTYVASQTTGTLDQLNVSRGNLVTKNQPLFILDPNPEKAQLDQANAQLKQAQSQLADLEQKMKRPSELAAIKAQRKQVIAKLNYSKVTVERYKKLTQKGFLDKETLDQAISNEKYLQSQLHEIDENLKTGTLSSRPDQIAAAKANVKAASAAVKKAQWEFHQKTIFAPVTGEVFDTYYRIGEVVPLNNPVLSILAPENIYAVFFVPEQQLSLLKLGQPIKVMCDSCKTSYQATISFISPKAEFTPPVVYSEKSRVKLVYRVEARFSDEDAKLFHPGQPITVNFK